MLKTIQFIVAATFLLIVIIPTKVFAGGTHCCYNGSYCSHSYCPRHWHSPEPPDTKEFFLPAKFAPGDYPEVKLFPAKHERQPNDAPGHKHPHQPAHKHHH